MASLPPDPRRGYERINPAALHRAIAERGLTHAEFADHIGMPAPGLSRILQGRTPVRVATIARIAQGLSEIEPVPGMADLLEPESEGSA
jgi:predicted transcriptional regulator